jgi:hypothetical protein
VGPGKTCAKPTHAVASVMKALKMAKTLFAARARKASDGIVQGSGEANDFFRIGCDVLYRLQCLVIHSLDNQDVLSVARFSLSTRGRAR